MFCLSAFCQSKYALFVRMVLVYLNNTYADAHNLCLGGSRPHASVLFVYIRCSSMDHMLTHTNKVNEWINSQSKVPSLLIDFMPQPR